MATFTVNTLVDENDGIGVNVSLRDAITEANNTPGADTIEFSIAGGTITLSNGELRITDDLTINGLGADQLTIDADGQSRVFNVDDGTSSVITVDIDGLTITGGQVSSQGGGILNQENLSITNSTISGNSATTFGGGIRNSSGSTVNVTNSTISGNSARGLGGGIGNALGTVNVTSSTISGNNADGFGGAGGIDSYGGTVNVTSSTISGNNASSSGGITSYGATVNVSSSIIADNVNDNDISGSFTSGGNNLIGNGDGGSGFTNGSNGDIVGTAANPVDPLLGPLQDNGGPTFTQELLAGSPAIDAGSNPENLTTDQRGTGFDRVVGASADIGAFEVQTLPNQAPVAVDDAETTDEDTAITIDVLANDTDAENDTLTVTDFDITGTIGTVTDNGDGTFSYDPNGQFEDLNDGETGTDSFTYIVSDGTDTNTATVNITINGVTDFNRIDGTRQDDNLRGTPQPDLITGNNGDDILDGRGNDDTTVGGRGGDIIRGRAGNDVLAADRVDRFDDFDGTVSELRGDSGNDTIFGGRKDDLIKGGADDDVLLGKSGNDTIRGGNGNDLLDGDVGNDTLIGGNDIDTVDYSQLVINGVFGTVAGLDINLDKKIALHSSTNNALSWTDRVRTVENVLGTQRNDRLIGDSGDNILDGQGEVGRSDRLTTFTDLDGDSYQVTADVVEYQGNSSDFILAGTADNFTVTGTGIGTDTLIDIEFVKFDDGLFPTSDLSFVVEDNEDDFFNGGII